MNTNKAITRSNMNSQLWLTFEKSLPIKIYIQDNSMIDDICKTIKDPFYFGHLLNGIGSTQLSVESFHGRIFDKNILLSGIVSNYDKPINVFVSSSRPIVTRRRQKDIKVSTPERLRITVRTGMKLRSGLQM